MATQANCLPTRIPSGNSIPTVLVEASLDGTRYIHQTGLPYSATQAVEDILSGQVERPERVIILDIAAGRCQDISVQVAEMLWRRAFNEGMKLDRGARDFAEHHAGLRPALAA